jgi:hypothetical protein
MTSFCLFNYGVVVKGGRNAAGVEWRVGPVVVCFKLQFRTLVHFSYEPFQVVSRRILETAIF